MTIRWPDHLSQRGNARLVALAVAAGGMLVLASVVSTLAILEFLGNDNRAAMAEPPGEVTSTINWPSGWHAPSWEPQVCRLAGDHSLSCRVPIGNKIRLSWGPPWLPVDIEPDRLRAGEFAITRRHLAPRWPAAVLSDLLSDASVATGLDSGAGAGNNACSAPPAYRLASVVYCPSASLDSTQCRYREIAGLEPTESLPNLYEIDWPEEGALPQNVYVELLRTSPNPAYRARLLLNVEFAEEHLDAAGTLSPAIVEADALPVAQPPSPAVAYDHGARISLFASRDACLSPPASGRGNWRPYSPIDIADEAFSARPCSWAKVVKGGVDLSLCAPGLPVDGAVLFSFERKLVAGSRVVVVVARSAAFDNDGIGSAIQQEIESWLLELRAGQRVWPLTLLVIDGDGRVRQVLRGEDLHRLQAASDEENPRPTIAGLVAEQITFHADGFRPLRDLASVERALHDLGAVDLNRVVYLTDGSLPEKLFHADLGTPLGWNLDGVELFVLTRGPCQPWIEQARVAANRCLALAVRDDVSRLRQLLRAITIDSDANAKAAESSLSTMRVNNQ